MPLSASFLAREFDPQLSVEIVDGKRLRVTTRCFRAAMLGPATAGVGVVRASLFQTQQVSLNGGQLAQTPIEQEKDGMLQSMLEFDVSKILLQAKDILGAPVVNPYDHGKFNTPSSPQPPCFTCAARTWTFLPNQPGSLLRLPCSGTLLNRTFPTRISSPSLCNTSKLG